RPRNRPGKGGKSGGFQGREQRPWERGPREPRRSDDGVEGGDDKPWERDRPAARAQGDGPRRFEKPSRERFDRPRAAFRRRSGDGSDRKPGRFDDKPRDKFRGRPERSAERTEQNEEARSDRPTYRGKPHHVPRRDGGRPQHYGGQWERRDAAFEENGEVWIW